MPCPAPSARLLSILRAQLNAQEFVCSSCLSRSGTRNALQLLRKRLSTRTRITPVTAVNAQKTIPPELKDLYDTLSDLGDSASIYTNASQLQLALRGLESKDSVTRVAGKSSCALNGYNGYNGYIEAYCWFSTWRGRSARSSATSTSSSSRSTGERSGVGEGT